MQCSLQLAFMMVHKVMVCCLDAAAPDDDQKESVPGQME
jgi:hypothetical protein